MSFMLYVFGLVVLLIGGVYGAHLLGLPQAWTIVAALVVLGLGLMAAVAKTRTKDVSE